MLWFVFLAVWFYFTASVTSTVTLGTCDTVPASFDTRIYLFSCPSSSCTSYPDLTYITNADDNCQTASTWAGVINGAQIEAGNQYYVRITDYSGGKADIALKIDGKQGRQGKNKTIHKR